MNLSDFFGKKEDLHEELAAKLITTDKGLKVIHHPLMIEVMPMKELYALYNERFKIKKEEAAIAMVKKDFEYFVFLHEKPYRLDAFGFFLRNSGVKQYDKKYWEILSEIWSTSENIWQQKDEWLNMLSKKVPNREYFMTAEERKLFKKLPNKIQVYRGASERNKDGFSWTTDRAKAEWFSKRWWVDGTVYEMEVDKKDVFALLTRRSESEIIYFPKK